MAARASSRSRPRQAPALRAGGFLEPLGSLHIGRATDAAAVDAFLAEFAGTGVALERVEPAAFVPGLRPDWTLGVMEPSSTYIDVAALHADCLARARRAGARSVLRAPLMAATRENGVWRLETGAGSFTARVLVNAAGAWADSVAAMAGVAPIGIQPYRRTMVQLRTDPAAPASLPHIVRHCGRFLFQARGGGTALAQSAR